jgi:tryptophanyl-tRNA synthetase
LPAPARHRNLRAVTTPHATPRTSLTGIKPTGTPHLGNLLGAIRPALELARTYERSLYFIADYHAFTSEHDPSALRAQIYDVAATWLACGLDPARTVFYRQSAVVEVFELCWIFQCLIAAGQLERGHAYKDALAKGEAPNAGVFAYPALMAADIILYDATAVPVGKDQKQHLEVARDVAVRMNHLFGEGTVVVPEAVIEERLQVPGLDGRKMSKSYGNHVPIFASAKELRAAILKIVTGSEPLEAPKEPDGTTLGALLRAVATPAEYDEIAAKLRAGGYGWGHAKQALFELLDAQIGPQRARYAELRADEDRLDAILEEGAEEARRIARGTMERVRERIGISRHARR